MIFILDTIAHAKQGLIFVMVTCPLFVRQIGIELDKEMMHIVHWQGCKNTVKLLLDNTATISQSAVLQCSFLLVQLHPITITLEALMNQPLENKRAISLNYMTSFPRLT